MQNIIPICFVFCLGTIFGSQIGEKNNKHWQLYLSTIHAVITLEHFSWIFLWTRIILLFISYICIWQQPKNAELFKFCRQICWKFFILPKYWIIFFSFTFQIFSINSSSIVTCFLNLILRKIKIFHFINKKKFETIKWIQQIHTIFHWQFTF